MPTVFAFNNVGLSQYSGILGFGNYVISARNLRYWRSKFQLFIAVFNTS